MMIGPDALGVQPLLESDGSLLPGPAGQDDGADIQADAAEGVDQSQGILVIGDAQIAADFAGLDIIGVDRDEDLFLVLHLQQHLDFAVRLEAREDAAGVVVVKELAAELQIELAAELVDPLHDAFRLHFCVLVVIKPDFHNCFSSERELSDRPRAPMASAARLLRTGKGNNSAYFTLVNGTRSRFPAKEKQKKTGRTGEWACFSGQKKVYSSLPFAR